MVEIIAHRGASKFVPENTMASFQKAHELGCRFIECDIALTQDQIPILIHDDTLDRTTNARGRIENYPYAYIANLDAGSWFNSEYANLTIPTLEEVLLWHEKTRGWINFEIKSVEIEKVELTVSTILEVLQRASYSQQIVFSSFQYEIMQNLKKKIPLIDKAFLSDEACEDSIVKALDTDCCQINVSNLWVTEYFIEKAHQVGLKVGVYTVNTLKDFKRLKSWGVDAVFTDDLKTIKPLIPDSC